MKKLILAVVLLGLFVPAALLSGCGDKVPAGAVAAVGDGVVTQKQYDEIWQQAQTQYKSQGVTFPKAGSTTYKQLKASIVAYLVQNEIIAQQAPDMGVEVTDKELSERMTTITQQVGGAKKLKKLLKTQGLTMNQLKEQLRASMLQSEVQQKVYSDITVTDDEITAYYNDKDNKSQFVTEATVTARHILSDTKADAQKVRALLVADDSDANWKKVAKKYSTDPGTKDSGGDLGSFAKGRMVAAFEDAAFALDIGEISQPVKTSYGWHVIQVTDKTKGSKQTLAKAKSTIKQTLLYTKQSKAWTKWLEDVEDEAGIAYAAGYDPDALTASPSPSASSAD